jgi:hypothetical protein
MKVRFDILKKEENGGVTWIEAVTSLQIVKVHVTALYAESKAEYIVFDQKTQKLMYTVPCD